MARMTRPDWRASLLLLVALAYPAQAQQPSASVQADVQQGLEEMQRGNFSAAEQHLARALAADPSLAEVRGNLGLAYYADHKYAEAVEAYRAALKQRPSLQGATAFLNLSLAALGRCGEALPGLRREFASNPDVKLRRVLGLSLQQCLSSSGDQAEADQVTQKLLAQYPDDLDVLYEAGQMYGKLSSQIYLRLMKVAPHSARGYQVMGEVSATEGNWQRAVDAYRQAIRLDPAMPGAHLEIATLLLLHSPEADAWQRALEELNAELKINPTSVPALYEVGEVCRKHGQPEQAISWFQRALKLDSRFVEARIGLAKALREQDRKQEAVAVLAPARETAPDNPAVHFLLSQLYRDLGRAGDAQREEAAFKQLQTEPQR
jgi:tetratricopeptide (TPR) repeat protein